MEVLIFLVARHMILGDTTPVDDFVSVISVGILCALRRYLHVTRKKEEADAASIFSAMDFPKRLGLLTQINFCSVLMYSFVQEINPVLCDRHWY